MLAVVVGFVVVLTAVGMVAVMVSAVMLSVIIRHHFSDSVASVRGIHIGAYEANGANERDDNEGCQ